MSRLSLDSRELIDAARDGDEPTADDRARVQAALARKIALGVGAGVVAATVTQAAAAGTMTGAASGGTVAAATTTATTSIGVAALGAGSSLGGGTIAGGVVSTIAGSVGAKILLSVAIVSAVGAGTVTYRRHEETKRVVQATVLAAANAKGARETGDGLATSNRTSTATATATATPTATPTATATSTATATATPKATEDAPLDAELSLLQDAHAALRANDGDRALRLLAEHARRFPHGQLREEAEAGRVFALCALGRFDEARDVAGRFLREHPRSPLAPRVSRACEDPQDRSTF